MIFCEEKKFIFISIPKTASTTIRSLLIGHHEPQKLKNTFLHSTLQELLNNNKIKSSEYFKFAFVRNPWERALSEYFFHKKRSGCKCRSDYFRNKFPTFLKFIEEGGLNECSFDGHARAQSEFITNENGEIITNFVGRFDNLESDIREVLNRLKINVPQKIPKKNFTNRQIPFEKYYDKNTKDIVGQIYKKDIETFGFKSPILS